MDKSRGQIGGQDFGFKLTTSRSRAVVVICRDEDSARQRFGVTDGETGIIYTHTGRRFFNDADLESTFLDRLRTAMTASGFWEKFNTSWACLDCELMPWSAKAQELLWSQYAAVGAAGNASVPKVVSTLQFAAERLNAVARSICGSSTARGGILRVQVAGVRVVLGGQAVTVLSGELV